MSAVSSCVNVIGVRLSASQDRALAALAEREAIDLILLFGSRVTGRPKAHNDVDIAVRFRNGRPDYRGRARVQEALCEVFPDETIDLATINGADPLFLHQIAHRCQLLAGSTRALAELKMLAFRRYEDFKPILAMERRYVKRVIGAL